MPGDEPPKSADVDRLDLLAQSVDREPMDAGQKPPMTPFERRRLSAGSWFVLRREAAAEHDPLSFEGFERGRSL